ncbi:MAG: ABC transporter ATP-binding protein [Defluviitaleaceae bacterium]|nr:ABC transporter ATP-binding protein [Defluviitaleaceae bacterium]
MGAALAVRNLEVSYGYIKAVKGISLTVEEGKIIALLGSNGAGKSSTIRAICGVMESKGKISFFGQDISKLAVNKRAKMGMLVVPEGRHVFKDLTVEDNLLTGAFTVSKAEQAKNFQRVYKYFPVLKERKAQIAQTLSGGEQQMLAIGRGLMGSPKILLLDEPSLGLAPLIVKELFEIIQAIRNDGTTVLLVEQNALGALKIADYAYVLEVGQINMEGPANELIEDPALIEAYLGHK